MLEIAVNQLPQSEDYITEAQMKLIEKKCLYNACKLTITKEELRNISKKQASSLIKAMSSLHRNHNLIHPDSRPHTLFDIKGILDNSYSEFSVIGDSHSSCIKYLRKLGLISRDDAEKITTTKQFALKIKEIFPNVTSQFDVTEILGSLSAKKEKMLERGISALTDEQKQKIKELYLDQHKTVLETAAETNIPSYLVNLFLKDQGVLRKRGSEPIELDELQRQAVDDKYTKEGKSILQIAGELNISPYAITRYLKTHGLIDKKYKQKIISDESITKIREMYIDQNKPMTEIADELGVGVWNVMRCVKENGWKIHNGNKSLTDEQKQKIKELYQSGTSMVDIAKQLEIPHYRVRTYIIKNNLIHQKFSQPQGSVSVLINGRQVVGDISVIKKILEG